MPKNLIDGFQKFLANQYDSISAQMPDLVNKGQDPKYFIMSCIDSRSNAGTLFQTPPGSFFSFKAMGAIVRPYRVGTNLAASLQFALQYNNVHTIVLLGHTGCGAVQAMVDKIDDPEISSFINVAEAGLNNAIADTDTRPLQRKAEEHTLRLSRQNLQQYPSVRKALDENRLTIKTWLFDMKNGAILEHNDKTDTFELIVERQINA